MTIPIGSVVTDVTLESLSASNQSNLPFTFGQVLKQGDLLSTESLTGKINGSDLPLQCEVKATHFDGSARLVAISGVFPSLPASTSVSIQLVKSVAINEPVCSTTPCNVLISAVINGVKYSATIDNTHAPNRTWLSGKFVQEKHFNVTLSSTDGTPHPHLFARVALRDYTSISNVRVDVNIENNWAFEPNPQDFIYDFEVSVNGNVVYTKPQLVHYIQSRFRRIFWAAVSPNINIKLNKKYLIDTRAVPNYDQSVIISEKTLAGYANINTDPMTIGVATAYMPTTGAHDDIGVMPQWSAAYVLSMDNRARDAVLITANGAGSFPMHYRDKDTDLPVSVVNHPYMTIDGRSTDTYNPDTKLYESFPSSSVTTACPFTPDIAHHVNAAYMAYLVSCDFYYLEEMQFWAVYMPIRANPNYRNHEQGLIISEQLRGQAWAIRTLAEGAAFTPDDHSLKKDLTSFLNNSLDWYNSTYSRNPDATKLGVMTHYFSLHSATQVAPWMDDFFVSALGHAIDLGFVKALPVLNWKSNFTVGRMTAPGVCWVTGAPYDLTVIDSATNTLFKTLYDCYEHDNGQEFMQMPCAGRAMAVAMKTQLADMGNISDGNMGYPSNMQPALAYSVDYADGAAKEAWDLFMSRTVKPDYSTGSGFSIVPRSYNSVYVPPSTDPEPTQDWQQIAIEGETVDVPDNTKVRYGAGEAFIEKIVSGSVPVTNSFFGGDPAPNVSKILEQLILTPPIEEPKMTFKVSVSLAFANQTLPAGSEAAVTSTLVELLDLTGAVVASSSSVYEFTGINAGDYVVRASGIDSKGAVMGVPYSQGFSIVDTPVVTEPTDPAPPIVTPPSEPAPQPVDVSLPSGVTVSYVKE